MHVASRQPLSSPRFRTLLITLLAVASGAADRPRCDEAAPDLTSIGIEAVMDMEVTSVSKKPEKLMEAAAAVNVISSEEIRRSGAASIPELLRLVPGVQVARIDSNKWAVGVRGFASRLSRSLLVLIDGRSVYSPLFAGVYWENHDVLLEDIERIEVIRGPGATLWGANAVNGVINIITKSAQRTQDGFVSADGGSNRLQGAVRYGGETPGGTAFRVYGRYSDRDAEFHESTDDFDGWHMGRGGFRADADRGARDHFMLQGDFYAGKSGQLTSVSTYASPYVQTLQEDADLSGANLLGQWRRVLSDRSDTSLQIYYDRTHRQEPSFLEDRDTFDADFKHHLRLGSRHDLLWGAGYRLSTGDTEGVETIQFTPASRTDDTLSAFVQDEIRLAPSRAVLTIGSKFEHNDYSGFEYQPNVRFLFALSSRQVVWSAVSRALRIPSRIEQDLSVTALFEPATPTFFRLLGSKDFQPERLTAYELGYRVQATERLLVDLTAFYDDYSRLLSIEPGSSFTETTPAPSHDVITLLLLNKMAATSRGAELAFDWRPLASWRLSGSYSYLDLDLVRADDSLDASTEASVEGSSPRHMAGLRSSLDFARGPGLDLLLRYTGSLPSQGIDAYTEMDLMLSWHVTPNLDLSLAGRNLLSAHHPEFSGGGVAGITGIDRSVSGRLVRRW